MHKTKESNNAQRFSADRPIYKLADDRLGRQSFAKALASAILGWQGKDSLVIALYGPWGTGKSSVKNMAIEVLKKKGVGGALVAEFNPWQFSHREQLTATFFDEIGNALGHGSVGTYKEKWQLLARWRRYAGYLKASGNLLAITQKPLAWILGLAAIGFLGTSFMDIQPAFFSFLGITFALIALLLNWSSRFAQAVTDLLMVGTEVGRKSLGEVKRELSDSIKQLNAPLLIVMDDLDRLAPTDVLEIFQLIKVNADFANVVFLLLFERTVITKHIESVLKVSGKDYLEKIVQVGFDMPVIERPRLEKVLFEGLDEIMEESSVLKNFDKHRWGNLFLGGLRSYFDTLRSVNRFLSTFAFHVGIFRGEHAFEVNPVDLIGLEVLRVFEPEVYRLLPVNKQVLTSKPERSGRENTARSTVQDIIGKASEEKKKQVEEIVKQLFPHAGSALGGIGYGEGFEDTWYRELRVCSAEVFDRYFGFSIPQGDISQSTIERIISAAADRDELRTEFESLGSQNLLGIALNRLEAYKETIPLEHALPFITALFDIGESLPKERPGFFELSPQTHATRIIYWYLRREPDSERRKTILRDAIQGTEESVFQYA